MKREGMDKLKVCRRIRAAAQVSEEDKRFG